jgi:hypothetical protein
MEQAGGQAFTGKERVMYLYLAILKIHYIVLKGVLKSVLFA